MNNFHAKQTSRSLFMWSLLLLPNNFEFVHTSRPTLAEVGWAHAHPWLRQRRHWQQGSLSHYHLHQSRVVGLV